MKSNNESPEVVSGPSGKSVSSSKMSLLSKFRCILIGLVMALVIGVAAPWWAGYQNSSGLFTDHHNAGVTFFIVVIGLLVNFVIGLAWKRARLNARELMFITAMMFASACISVTGTVAHFVPAIAAPHYRQLAGDAAHFRPPPNSKFYREAGGSILLKPELYPLDPDDKGTVAIRKFWEGVREKEPVRMSPWVQPLLIWGIMLVAVYAMSASAMSIMRKQWVDHEHLSYPIAQVPAEICSALANPKAEGSIFQSKAFWLGAGLVFFGASLGGVYHYLTGQAGMYLRVRQAVVFEWTGGVEHKLEFWLDVVIMGLVFLIPNRVAFSVWFMTLLAWFWNGMCKTYGIGLDTPMAYGGDPSLQFLIMGAMIVFVGSNLWHSRGHLKRVFRCALGRGDRDYDTFEPTSYRTALIVFAASIVVGVLWLRYAGVPAQYGLFYMAALFVIFYGIARVIAQCGLPTAGAPLTPEAFTVASLGASNMSPQAITGLYSQVSWHQNMRQVPTVGTTHGTYLAGRNRGLFFSMLLAMAITYLAGAFTTVYMCYTRGGAMTMGKWIFRVSSFLPWMWSSVNITQQPGPAFAGFMWGGVGALIMAVLVIGQRMFFWWPLHPVGLIMCTPHLVRVAWFPIMITWMVKVAILKFGGHKAYRKARRFAIGAVVGMFVAAGFWAALDTLTGTVGNRILAI